MPPSLMDLCAIHDDLVVILVGFVRAIEYAETQFDPEAPVGTGVDSGKGFQGVAVWAASGVRTHHQNEERDMKHSAPALRLAWRPR